MDAALLDTDILSEVFKRRNAVVSTNAANYLAHHGKFQFSSVTRYEVLRGLKARSATTGVQSFDLLCRNSTVIALSDSIFDRAADLWAYGKQSGHHADDGDFLIAATALELGLAVVTGNTAHFQWMPGVRLANWRSV